MFFSLIKKKNLNENLSFKFLITKIVFFEISKNLRSKDQILFDKDYYDLVNFVNSFQNNYSKKFSDKIVKKKIFTV